MPDVIPSWELMVRVNSVCLAFKEKLHQKEVASHGYRESTCDLALITTEVNFNAAKPFSSNVQPDAGRRLIPVSSQLITNSEGILWA